MHQRKDLKLTVLMVLGMLTWGLSWTNAKILGLYADAPLIMFWRFLFATISFTIVVRWSNATFQISRNNILFIFFNSIFMVSYNYFYFKGTQIGLAGAGGVLVTTLNPILTAIFSSMFFGGLMLNKDWVGLGLGLASGGIILRLWELSFENLYHSGNLFFILASLSWVAVTIITSKSKEAIPFITYSFWSFLFSTFISLPIALGENILSVIYFDWIFWLNLMILSILAMSFGTSIYFLASIKLGPKKASSFIFLVPLTAMAFAMYYLSEPLELYTLIGGTIGIGAVYIINN